ncbi:MAG TPA: adenylosuccinate lyase [Bacteroidales bacterium]|nr:adenylosuccinate lyase [Bacteroidales bacterium]
MESNYLFAVSPVDGRYYKQTEVLSEYFSEFALMRYRIATEIAYFTALCDIPLPGLEHIDTGKLALLRKLVDNFYEEAALRIKELESVTNHDVKAVEYYLKEKFETFGLDPYKEFIHFGLTSQDVNNTAVPASLRDFFNEVYFQKLDNLCVIIKNLANEWSDIPMLARTHGQPASPTRLGKEFLVFHERLSIQLQQLKSIPISAKFGGATGNMNAHYVTYPNIDWQAFATDFVENRMGLSRSFPTTQIEHYDNLAAVFHAMSRINTILIDMCRDIWTYVSMDYFKQKIKAGEVGSSAMPHKVNPIDFENAEGNLGIANALFSHLAEKLPVSRLQRDLTDSTVLRNIGVPVAHTLIAFNSISKGLGKLLLNKTKIDEDLERNLVVVAEAIQSILRRENYPKPYEALKNLTRTNESLSPAMLRDFIVSLDVSDEVKQELLAITPFTYLGK